ncbi:hypothetical protein D3C85_1358710 [compost metagenome]
MAIDEQHMVVAILTETKIAPDHCITTTYARATRILETITGQLQVDLTTYYDLH